MPSPLAFVAIPGFANNVDVSGNFAYVAAGGTGLQVVDVSDRNNPVVVGSADTPGNANDVKVVDSTAFIADGSAGLQVVDVADPTNPTIIGAVDTPGVAWDVVVNDSTAYLADGASGLQIIDISDPTAPSITGAADTPGIAKGADVQPGGSLAVVADGVAGLQVIDVSDPANPALQGVVDTGDARDVVLDAGFAFVAEFSNSFTTVDISDPAAPVIAVTVNRTVGGLLMDVALNNDFAFGADVFFVNGVPIIFVGDASSPVPRAILDFRNFRDDDGTGIAVDERYVYLAAGLGITENGVTGNTRLYIGEYRAIFDVSGIPPEVTITAPVAGTVVLEGTALPIITVDATDDVLVVAVDLLVDGAVVATDLTAPYEFNFQVPLGAGPLTLAAAAIDLGSNIGVAPDVVVNVVPDPLTTVIGKVVDSSGLPAPSAIVNIKGTTLGDLTKPDGTFTIPSIRTVQDIEVDATFIAGDGTLFVGSSGAVVPECGGVTDLGTIATSRTLFQGLVGTITTIAGTGMRSISQDGGLATETDLNSPNDVVADRAGNIFITEASSRKIRRVDAQTGIITTFAGTGGRGFAGDGGPATDAQLWSPSGLSFDSDGNLFFADAGNGRVRRIDAGTGIITLVAGSGTFLNDGQLAITANLSQPFGITIDPQGNILIADTGHHRIRRVAASTGIISTVSGIGVAGFAGDGGGATQARLSSPSDVALDSSGSMYIADKGNLRIRRVDAQTGLITTVVGTGAGGFSGDGGPATDALLNAPSSVEVDAAGNLFIADSNNNRVRRVDAETGIITTIAGTGVAGSTGDGGPATDARLNLPFSVSLQASEGSRGLLIIDRVNHSVRGFRVGEDSDTDGLSDNDELVIGTDPLSDDSDGDGLLDGEELLLKTDPRLPDSLAPIVTIASPSTSVSLVEEDTVLFKIDASDDRRVARVDLFFDGNLAATKDASPFEFSVAIPVGVSSITVRAEATDTADNVGVAEDTFQVIPDPLTIVIGSVVDIDDALVAGADVVEIGSGIAAVTDVGGAFSIPNVPTIFGNIVVRASTPVGDKTLEGISVPLAPVRGGITDVGTINVMPIVALYSISPRDDQLRIIDPDTAQTLSSVIIVLSGETVVGVTGLATNPFTGELWAILKLGDPKTNTRELVTIDTVTGEATRIGDTGDRFAGLAFDSDGTLYGVTGDGANTSETLFTLSLTDATPTLVLSLDQGFDGEAIAFNPNDGLIYHASGFSCHEVFESIDPDTLAIDVIFDGVCIDYEEATALTHLEGDILLLADLDNPLYQITTAGDLTLVGAMDHTSKGLAFAPARSSGP